MSRSLGGESKIFGSRTLEEARGGAEVCINDMWRHPAATILFRTILTNDDEMVSARQVRKRQRRLTTRGVRKKMSSARRWESLLAWKNMFCGATYDCNRLHTRSPSRCVLSTVSQNGKSLNPTASRKSGPESSLKSTDTLLQALAASASRHVKMIRRSSFGRTRIDARP